ncbi:hypothetical protein [Singulisphaera sp. PoT]|uniref:hypothetical protein n=1 Tax=Singulisphaera sp. PoT TaxID=3411797 RepID=UPI003BF47174
MLIYKRAFNTGFRKIEIKALMAGDMMLDGPHPRVFLTGERCKGKRDALRSDFCPELAAWVVEASSPLFTIP